MVEGGAPVGGRERQIRLGLGFVRSSPDEPRQTLERMSEVPRRRRGQNKDERVKGGQDADRQPGGPVRQARGIVQGGDRLGTRRLGCELPPVRHGRPDIKRGVRLATRSSHSWPKVADTMGAKCRYARITQSGSLVPSIPPILQLDDPPTPPVASSASSSSWLPLPRLRTIVIGGCALLTTGLVLEAVLPPHTLRRLFAHPSVRSTLPPSILPRLPPPSRPRKTSDGSGRLEAVLVLGADPGTPGATIARDMARKGFVVLASVRRTSSVKTLEKDGRGWIKVLVLDPTDSTSFTPFVRSVTASLSLRFPLHSPGDAFVSDGCALSLSGLVNALPLGVDPFERIRPVEAVDAEDVERAVRETAGTAVGIIKALLPMMRTAAGRPGAPDAVVLTLRERAFHLIAESHRG